MQLSDVTVEVRDKTLTRIGLVRPEDLDLKVYPVHNDVGTWELKLPAEHPLALALRTPGAGVIITGPTDVILSGPCTNPNFESTPDDPVGTVTFSGISDTHVLQDRLCYPLPTTADVTAQTVSHDVRTGAAETVMRAFVNANVGPSAPSARKNANLTLATDLGRGGTVTKTARFPVLLNLLQEIAAGANLGFRVVQRGSGLVFEVYDVTDRTATIRLDIENGTLAGQKVSIRPPGTTRIIVAGQGDEEDRQFIEVTNTAATTAETDWARRIEFFKDQRNTNDVGELTQAGLDQLADNGFTALSVQAVPSDNDQSTMRLGIDWGLGDLVGVVIEDEELSAVVTGLAIIANELDGFKVGALIGDPAGFDYNALVRKRLTSQATRISQLERNVEVSATLAGDVTALDTRVDALETVACRLFFRNTVFNLATGTTPVAVGGWSNDTGDDGGANGVTISSNVVTFANAGLFHVVFSFVFPAAATGIRQCSIWKNPTFTGTSITGGTQLRISSLPANNVAGATITVSAYVQATAGMTLAVGVNQNSGSTLSVGSITDGAVTLNIVER